MMCTDKSFRIQYFTQKNTFVIRQALIVFLHPDKLGVPSSFLTVV